MGRYAKRERKFSRFTTQQLNFLEKMFNLHLIDPKQNVISPEEARKKMKARFNQSQGLYSRKLL
jgi:hypothetical protein